MGVIVIEGLVIAALVLKGLPRGGVSVLPPGVGTSPELFLGFGAGRTA
jgi:hypothetical protein